MNPAVPHRQWGACAALLRHTWQAHTNKSSNWLTWMLGACAMLFAAAAFALDTRFFKLWMAAAGISLGMLVLMWWILLLSTLVQQNFGVGRLVPGIGRHSKTLLLVVLPAAVLAVATPFVLAGTPVLATVLFAALVLVTIALTMMRPVIGLLAMAALIAPPIIGTYVIPLSDGTVLAIRIFLGIVAAGVALRTLYGPTRVVSVDPSKLQLFSRELTRSGRREFDSTLKRDCLKGNPDTLVLHCLPPQAPPRLVYALALVTLTYVMATMAPVLVTLVRDSTASVFIFLVFVFCLPLLLANTLNAGVRQSAGEQALVMLSVHRPVASAINALLARRLLLHYGRAWLVSVGVLFAIFAIFGATTGELVWLLAIGLSTLAAGALLLKNYAVSEQASSVPAALMVIGAAATFATSMVADRALVVGLSFAGGCNAEFNLTRSLVSGTPHPSHS